MSLILPKNWAIFLLLLLVSCTPSVLGPQATPTPIPSPTPVPLALWAYPGSPPLVRDALDSLVTERPGEFIWAAEENQAQVVVSISAFNTPPADGVLLGTWAYAPAVPFPTYADEVSFADLQAYWAGEVNSLAGITNDGSVPTLFLSQEALDTLSTIFGPPAVGIPLVIVPSEDLLQRTWETRPSSFAIVPFEELEPRWKVLTIDGLSVLDRGIENYPLLFGIWMGGDPDSVGMARVHAALALLTNRDESQMTSIVMTGVTALVRGTAARMEINGILYPAEEVAPLLQSADITHISNEIPFNPDCPYPDTSENAPLVFCSAPRYMELLQFVGADVIELTGNHMNDYGNENLLYTLDYYDEVGIPYYAAGRNLAEASAPLIIEHNGNKIAFIGCNYFGLWEPASVLATADSPGAAPCDFPVMHAEIARLKEEGAVVITTWQNYEVYNYWPAPEDPSQILDAEGLIAAGASILSGSQSHQPQGFEFYSAGFIHYGLGNLFFDQMWSLGTRQEFLDRHIIYDGRHISTQLFTYLLEDFARPRPMTPEERRELLSAVFTASGW